jgi:hypothetical protein
MEDNPSGIRLVSVHHKVPFDVYIGRPGKGAGDNVWKNPYIAKSRSLEDIQEVVKSHRRHLWNQLCSSEITVEELLDLRGKTLACFCADRDGVTRKPCHGTNIIGLVNYLISSGITSHDQFLNWLLGRQQ